MPFHPAPGRSITSPFGPRKSPISGIVSTHRAIDFDGPAPVLFWDDGTVVSVGANMNTRTGFGNYITVEHTPDLRTLYAHGKTHAPYRKGDRVRGGASPFVSGSTGASTGDHLHFEVHVRRLGLYWVKVDPAPYLANLASLGSTPISEEEEDPMKIIAPFGGDAKAVIGPGIGHTFTDWDSYVLFCNVWGFNPDAAQVIGDASVGKDTARRWFNETVALHRPPTPASVNTASIVAAVRAAIAATPAGSTVDVDAIAAAVEARLQDDFAGIPAATRAAIVK